MAQSTSYEISFATDDPALVEELLACIPAGEKEAEIRPGIVIEQKDLRTTSGIVGSDILLTIACKVLEGVAVKVLVDVLMPLVRKYGARLKINGKAVAGDEQAVEAGLAGAQGAR